MNVSNKDTLKKKQSLESSRHDRFRDGIAVSRSVLACFSRSINFMRNTVIFLWIFIRLLLCKRITFRVTHGRYMCSIIGGSFYLERRGHCFCATCTVTVFPHTFFDVHIHAFFDFRNFRVNNLHRSLGQWKSWTWTLVRIVHFIGQSIVDGLFVCAYEICKLLFNYYTIEKSLR